MTKPEDYYSWFRSEQMSLCQLYLQSDSVYHIVALLGEKGICQFRDLNQSSNSFQRKYVAEIRRCAEMERKIVFFEKEMERDGVSDVKKFDHHDDDRQQQQQPIDIPSMKDLSQLEQRLEKLEHDLLNENKTQLQMKHRLLSLTEYKEILRKADQFFNEAQSDGPSANKSMLRRMSVVDPDLMRRFSMHMHQPNQPNQLNQIPLEPVIELATMTGSILASRFMSFERMLWRVSRGNILLKRIDVDELLEDPETGELQHKCLFILVCQGEKLRNTCQKICTGFHAKLYSCPEQRDERNSAHQRVLHDICDIQNVIARTNDHRKNLLVAIATNLQKWKTTIIKVKNTYETMNLFSNDVTGHCLIAECWIPSNQIAEARSILVQGQMMSNSLGPSILDHIPTIETPPTYNVSNKFTAGFQALVDSYGSCTYGEVNPAPYAIISFPFIFAVMFGDTGHGIIMALFALWMIIKEKQLKSVRNEIFSMFFAGRYTILLMGLFSIYTGAMYNDIFSKSVNLFGTAFHRDLDKFEELSNVTSASGHHLLHLVPDKHLDQDFRYYFGMDPVWQIASNKVQYTNTYKMKLSVILGVLQMFFGVILSVFNHCHYSEWISVWVEFIPQLVFLLAIFGYMNFMIFFKWFAYDSTRAGCAPSILITLINMFMFKMPDEKDPCYLKDEMFPGQFTIQSIFIILALLSVPIMLLIKPLYLLCRHHGAQKSTIIYDQNSFEMENSSHSNQNLEAGNVQQQQEMVSNSNGNHIITVEDNTSQRSEHEVKHVEHDGNNQGHAANATDEFSFGDVFINQTIHTIEYCLGSVSHTASYLRLWALSLAHAELSEVLWNMVMIQGFMEFKFQYGYLAGAVVMFFVFAFWAILTVVILIVMEGLSAFLHALRLHWVEFMSKFYHGAGYPFEPFDFRTKLDEL
ncbi:Unc-32p [Dermatophagoides farinae]|uniref:V-type proton ATPase subunit a n=1 Tax=Dermatophagoides farinae TaxID=6954 RepID=A0A922L8X9_DERFA|nr:Unc-32p [Dermatophagoides farinae]